MNKNKKIFAVAVFSALICAGWLIAIPIGSIPIVLQNALAVLAGMILGPICGAASVALFLLLGALGLPVFSGGRGGAAVFAGPTGGFLVGYFFAAVVAGCIMLAAKNTKEYTFASYAVITFSAVAGMLTIYVFGLPWFKYVLSLSWMHTVLKGFLPFIVPDLLKAIVLVPVAVKIIPIIRRFGL